MMLSNLKNKIILPFIFSILFFPVFVGAQVSGSGNDINVKIQPEFPRAYDDISISIESYSVDLNQSKVNWYKNNILEKSGIGKNSFSFQVGGIGTSDTVVIQISSSRLGKITKTITIRPAEVDLIWETDSITPPLYKGKALSSYQSEIKVIAVPNMIDGNGKKLSPENLIYKWKKDWKVLGSKSGYGRDTLVINGFDNLRDGPIRVEVESSGGKYRASGSVLTKTYQPKVVLYENNPILGVVYDKAISYSLRLREEEVDLVAVPFFFSKNSRVEYNWFMNNKKINNRTNNLVLRQQEGEEGSTAFRLEVQNLDKIMQSAQNNIKVIFGEMQR